jgi:hypothetical protein
MHTVLHAQLVRRLPELTPTLLLSRPGATCALKNLLVNTTLLAGSMMHMASGQRGVGVSTAVKL